MKLKSLALAAAVAVMAVSRLASANALITNGSFESNTGNGQLGFNTTVTGWSVPNPGAGASYTFLYAPGTADTIGANGQYGNVGLWGPNNGSPNGLPATSPDGGYYLAEDGDFQVGAISQTVSGLTVGSKYTISFDWAAAQQSGFAGASTEQFQVGFGSSTQSTPVLSIASEGFSGWQSQSFLFTADATSDVLSFLAVGTPNGVPTFALLDGVVAVPAVGSSAPLPSALSIGTVLMIGVAAFRARRSKVASI
jgi:hypothetical protein